MITIIVIMMIFVIMEMKKMIKQRYNIMLNPAIVSKIDHYANHLDMSRSELINKILFDTLRDFGDVPDLSDPEVEGQTELDEVIA